MKITTMSNVILFTCYSKSQITVPRTKHINMNKSVHDKIAHQQLKLPLLIVENVTEYTGEHSSKNIGSES